MRIRLPLLGDPSPIKAHEKAHTYCAYCPKLCRHSCPVGNEHASETTTPWGKMSTLHHAARGNVELTPDRASTFWACTGCMRCRSYCDHQNDVGSALRAGRSVARDQGVAPAASVQLATQFETRLKKAEQRGRVLFASRSRANNRGVTEVVALPGCSAIATEPAAAEATVRVIDHLVGATRVDVAFDQCCGLPLLEAGDREGFARAATRLSQRCGSAKLVTGDPGCAHALRVLAKAQGVEVPEVQHLTEFAHEHRDRFKRTPDLENVRYHDACRLGRGLNVYNEPRELLSIVLGAAPREFYMNREKSECSGGGGLLPLTDRRAATGIARGVTEAHARHSAAEGSGSPIVSACPTAVRRFNRATLSGAEGGPDPAQHLSVLLANAL